MNLRTPIILLSLICLIPYIATAQESQSGFFPDTILHVKEVEIVGSKYPYITITPAQTLSGARIARLNSLSVADAVRYFSGAQIKDYGGVGGVKTLDVRAMGTNHLGVFYDGIQLGNAQNGQIDLGKFSLDNMESIALYHGEKSDIFQSARDFGASGTIYLTSRRPRFTDGKRTNLRLVMRTGSFGLLNPSLLWEQKLSNRVTLSANAEYTYATGRYKFRYHKKLPNGATAWDTTATRVNGDIHALRAEAGLYGTFRSGSWNAKAYYYDSERGIPGAIINNVWYNSQRQWDRNVFVQGGVRNRFSNSYDFKLNAKYARDYMHYLNPDTLTRFLDNRFWQDEIYISAVNKFTILPTWDISLSTDYQWNSLGSSLDKFSDPERNTLLAALATAYQWQGLKLQGSMLATFISDTYASVSEPGKRGRSNMARVTPSVFIAYRPVSELPLNIRAFYKRIFRMPTFNDLYYTESGNTNLKPEYATQYNIGAQYQFVPAAGNLTISFTADAYYNRVTDKIIAVPKGNSQYRWMMMNIGEARITGIDASSRLSTTLGNGLNIDAAINYTWQRALDYTNPASTGYGGTYKGMIPYIPRHSGSFVLQGSYKAVELNYSFIYVGERYTSSANIVDNHVPAWYTHDISVGYGLRYRSIAYHLSLQLNNVLNKQYEVIANYPMPGRNFKVILKIEI